jgi:NADP-dependent aldehyde dehydrogenase
MMALVDSTPPQSTRPSPKQPRPPMPGPPRRLPHTRRLLGGLAAALERERESLVALANDETSLGPVRLNGELDRTAFQLRGFADQLDAGATTAVLDEPAVAGAPPAGRPRLTRVRVPVGPVAMFAASNFPFAFSVLGGDTASALAAGCPVVIKAHPGHPQLSRTVFELASAVVAELGRPGRTAHGRRRRNRCRRAARRHPSIAAVAFTGSFRGGAALQAEANARPQPIPFYGELARSIRSSRCRRHCRRGAELHRPCRRRSASRRTFCTSPGVLLVFDDAVSQGFVDGLKSALAKLTPHGADGGHPQRLRRRHGTVGESSARAHAARRRCDERNAAPALVETDAARPLPTTHCARRCSDRRHRRRVRSVDEAIDVLRAVGGSLTVTLWGADDGSDDTRRLTRAATRIAGRVLSRASQPASR